MDRLCARMHSAPLVKPAAVMCAPYPICELWRLQPALNRTCANHTLKYRSQSCFAHVHYRMCATWQCFSSLEFQFCVTKSIPLSLGDHAACCLGTGAHHQHQESSIWPLLVRAVLLWWRLYLLCKEDESSKRCHCQEGDPKRKILTGPPPWIIRARAAVRHRALPVKPAADMCIPYPVCELWRL